MFEVNDRKPDSTFSGLRKLIRPRLPGGDRRRDQAHAEAPLSAHMGELQQSGSQSHAEAFYFQKQIQQQTEMIVVLEDGEELHGTIEWYDKFVLKLRNGRHRILIYKAAIKYMFKASDAHPAASVMK